jgi:hypothetical protein
MSAKSTLALVTVAVLGLAAVSPTTGLARSLGGDCPGGCGIAEGVRGVARSVQIRDQSAQHLALAYQPTGHPWAAEPARDGGA